MQLLFFLAALAAVSSLGTDIYQCRPNVVCGCGQGAYGSSDLVCPKMTVKHPDPILKLQVWPQIAATLECRSTNGVQYEWLTDNHIGHIQTFTVVGCPISNISFGEFMTNVGVNGATKLTLQASGKDQNSGITKQSFQGLNNIKELRMYNFDELPLSDGAFSEMVNLTTLDLRDDNVSLSGDVFYNLKNLRRLELANVNLTYLEPGIFKPLTSLRMLHIWGNTLRNLTRETFAGLANLTILGLSANAIYSLPQDVFTGLSKLKNLSLYANNFASLPEGLFTSTPVLEQIKLNSNRKTLASLPNRLLANLTALKEVYLHDCNISHLPEDLFWNSANISLIKLSTNLIKTLPKLLFRDAKNLKKLDLSYNKLETLPDNIFVSLENLEILHLDHNYLTTLNEAMLQGLLNIKILFLNNNALSNIDSETFRSTLNLRELYMSHNHITFNNTTKYEYVSEDLGKWASWSPLQHCRELQVLHLANNNISEIYNDWQITLIKLHDLNLQHNNIKQLEVYDLTFGASNLIVDLRYNQIATIDMMNADGGISEESVQIPRNVTVKLDGNPIQCDCGIYFFLKYLENRLQPHIRRLMTLLPGNLQCAGPRERKGTPVTALNSHTITCELSSGSNSPVTCPQQCSCSIRPEDRALIVDCSNAGLHSVPPSLPKKVPNIELILDNNTIQSLPTSLLEGYSNVKKLSLSYNNITWLSNESLTPNLKELHLDHNNLTQLNSSLLETWANKTKLTLHGNPWECNCDTMDFFNFLQTSYKQVQYLNNVTCKDGRPLVRLTATDLCPLVSTMVVGLSVAIATIGIFVGLLAAVYFRYQNEIKIWLYAHNMCLRFVTEEELDKDKIYDAFVSYSHKDEDFVSNKLLPGLESGPTGFKLCVHYRNWIAGEFITTQITRSVQESRRTLVVLSPNFIKSEWGRLEFRAAHKQALSEGRARVIVVIYGDIGSFDNMDNELKTYLTTNTYVKWGDPWFWDKLRYALPHRKEMQSNKSLQKPKEDKIELVTPSTPAAGTTPPTDIINNPLDVGNGFINHGSNNILMQDNGSLNGAVKCI